jgi:hypothetical protein
MATHSNGYDTTGSIDWRELRAIALQESMALRAYARLDKLPKARKLIWPWDEGYLGHYEPTARTRELEHGTVACYRQHLRLGTKPCEPCRDANNALAREERKRLHSPSVA